MRIFGWVGLVAMGVALAAVPQVGAQQCDDFNECTTNDMCSGGQCTGSPASSGSCDDFNDCTINDRCQAGIGCMGDPAPVNTACQGGCGKCTQLVPVPGVPLQCTGVVGDNGKACDASDLNPCLVGSCQIFGVPGFPSPALCIPRLKECPSAGNCRGGCNPETGNCDNSIPLCIPGCERCQGNACVPDNLGGACDDFNECTPQSRCEALDVGGTTRGLCMAGAPSGNTPTPTVTGLPVTPTATVGPPTATRTAATPPTPGPCVGDCGQNGTVTVNELIIGVNIALGFSQVDDCPSFDTNSDGSVAVNELISGVNALLNGCTL